MNINKNFAVFLGVLLGFFTLSNFASGAKDRDACCVCGRKDSHGKKTSERYYTVNSTNTDFSSCFGPVNNANGVLCSAFYRALNKYKISKKI
jgi:hypothetical protein